MHSEKNRIIRKALQLFLKEGIKHLANEDVMAKLDLKPNTYYSYFRDVADLFEQTTLYSIVRDKKIHQKIIDSSDNAVEELMGLLRYGADAITQISPQYFEDVLKHYPRIVQIGKANSDEYTIPLYAGIIDRGVKQGLFRKDINVQIVTRFIMESAFILLNYRTFPPERYSPGEVLRNIYLYYFRGLCVVEAMHLVDEHFAKRKVIFSLDDDDNDDDDETGEQ